MSHNDNDQEVPLLPEDVPVVMPELPRQHVITAPEQYKAVGDPTRMRIVHLVEHQPMTVKQMATQLGMPPGTVGHHVQILDTAGLLQVVARRLVRGIVAKYYARTARIFLFDLPKGEPQEQNFALDRLGEAHEEIDEAITRLGKNFIGSAGFPHTRISQERLDYFTKRLHDLFDEFIAEPYTPDGMLIGLVGAIFTSPPLADKMPESEGEQA
jgi:DNA-binding transcriptional ArsR family regulator